MPLTALMKCFQILEEVFSYDMEGDTAMQASVVNVFFLMAVFFPLPFCLFQEGV